MTIENNQTNKRNSKTRCVHTIRVIFYLVTKVLREVLYSTFRLMEESLLFSYSLIKLLIFTCKITQELLGFFVKVLHEVESLLLRYISYKSLTFTCACTREPGDFGMKVFKNKDSLNGLENMWKDQNIDVFLDLSIELSSIYQKI